MRNINQRMTEIYRKRRAERGEPPTPAEWVSSQPERWRLICTVFAVNVNTCGGIISKTLEDIVQTANGRGYKISLATIKRALPDLERYRIVRQERNWYPNGHRAPSTWLLGLRRTMPENVMPPLATAEEKDQAWLKANGMDKAIAEMNARVAAQSPEPPF